MLCHTHSAVLSLVFPELCVFSRFFKGNCVISAGQSSKRVCPVLLAGCALVPSRKVQRDQRALGPAARGLPLTFRFGSLGGSRRVGSSHSSSAGAPPPLALALPASGHRLSAGSTPPCASFVPEGREELGPPRLPGGGGDRLSRAPRSPAARALLGSSLGGRVSRGGGVGAFWPLPSSGGWAEGPETRLWSGQLPFGFCAEGEGSYLSAVGSPCV